MHRLGAKPSQCDIVQITPALLKLIGGDEASLLGRPIAELLASAYHDDYARALAGLSPATPTRLSIELITQAGHRKMRATLHGFALPGSEAMALLILGDQTMWSETADYQRAYGNLALRLAGATNAKEAAMAILNLADEMFGWDACHLNLYHEGKDETWPVIQMDTVDGQRMEFPPPAARSTPISPMSQRVLALGAQLILIDEHDAGSADTTDDGNLISFGTSRRSLSLMYVPIRSRDRSFGVLSIQSYRSGMYRQEDLEGLQVLADYCAGALERLIAEDRLRTQSLIAQCYARLGQRMASAQSIDDTGMGIADASQELFRWDSMFIVLTSEDGSTVRWAYAMDTVGGLHVRAELNTIGKAPSPLVRSVMKGGPRLTLRSPDSPPRTNPGDRFGDLSRESSSLLLVPLRIGDRHIGVLSVQSYTVARYSEKDLEQLQALADHCSLAFARAMAMETSRLFQRAVEESPAALAILDARRRVEYVNPAFVRLCGQSASEVVGHERTFEAADYATRETIQRLWNAVDEGERFEHPFTLARRDGSVYVEQKAMIPLRDAQGRIANIVEMGVDITEAQEARRALTQSNEELEERVRIRTEELSLINQQLRHEINYRTKAEKDRDQTESLVRAILESSPSGIITVDRRGRITLSNWSWFNIWRIPEGHAAGARFKPFLKHAAGLMPDPSQLLDFVESIEAAPRQELQANLRLDDGRILVCESRPQIIDGKHVGRIYAVRDVTDKERATEQVFSSESIYRKVIESTLGVPYKLYYEDTTRYAFIGTGIADLMGISADDATPDSIGDLVQEYVLIDASSARTIKDYHAAFKSGLLNRYRVDIHVRLHNGQEKWISDSSIPLREEKTGRILGSLGILMDITDRKQAEERELSQQQQLAQTERLVALGTLVSGVAHEVNNPNNFIMMNAPTLRQAFENATPILDDYFEQHGEFVLGGLPYSEMRDYLPRLCDTIVHGCKRIDSIVRELRDFARPKPETYRESVDINHVVKSALILLHIQIERATNQFFLELAPELPIVIGNALRLEQVIINLVLNSCEALPTKRSKILLKTYLDESANEVVILVEDEGRGIASEHLKRITDPFFTTKRDMGGTGLGLSISSNIILNHGGTLEFDSEAGRGTTVMVRLPVAPRADVHQSSQHFVRDAAQ